MFKVPTALFSAAVVSWSVLALAEPPAQSTTGEAPADTEDLEVPASTPAANAGDSPKATPAASAQPSSNGSTAAEPSRMRAELDELRARLLRVEASHVTARPVPTSEQARREPEAPVNLEATAHSRPVATGLQIGGYLQAQYEANQLSEDQLQQGGVPLNQNRFLLRRGRLRVDRGWEYAAATLELEANTIRGPNVGIRRAEGSVFYRGDNPRELPPLVMLTLGITDLPFGYELAESARMRPFMERSQSSLAFFPSEMDAGAKLSGAISFFRYAVALTNGEPIDNVAARFPRDPNAAKDVTGRFGVDIAATRDVSIAGGTSFSRGKGFHAGSDATKASFVWRDDNEDSVLQPNSEIFGVPGQAATRSKNFERWAFGLDLELKLRTWLGDTRAYGEAYIASNYDRAVLIADPVSAGRDIRHIGGYGAFIQDITRYGFVGFRGSIYDPNSDLLDSRRGKLVPRSQTIRTFSPIVGARLPERATLSFQYDFVRDSLAKDARGVPTDAKNDQWTVRLQVEL